MRSQAGHIDRSSGYRELVCGCGDRRSAEERDSFGCYAGIYCDACWPKSGYRDAVDPSATFDPAYAGESLEAD